MLNMLIRLKIVKVHNKVHNKLKLKKLISILHKVIALELLLTATCSIGKLFVL